VGDDREPKIREGMEFVCEIPAGASIRYGADGTLYIAHPDHPLRMVRPGGKVEEVRPLNE